MASSYDSVWVPTLTGVFLTSYEGELKRLWGQELMRQITDPVEFLKVVDLGSVGAVRQFVGPRQSTAPKTYTLTQQNVPWEITLEIDVEDVNRDHIGMWESKVAEMGAKFADHPTKLMIADIIANPTCFDTGAFFATHTNSGNTIINDVSATQVASLACGTAATPTTVEAANQIVGLLSYFYTFKDEAGDPINGAARKFIIATSNPQIHSQYQNATTSQQITSGQTNPVVAGYLAKGWVIDVVLDPRLGLASSAVVYLFRADSIVKPFIWGEEKAMQIQYLGEGSDSAVKNNKYVWAAKAVRSVGVGRYQHAMRATLS